LFGTEVRDCDLLIVVTSSTFLKRKDIIVYHHTHNSLGTEDVFSQIIWPQINQAIQSAQKRDESIPFTVLLPPFARVTILTLNQLSNQQTTVTHFGENKRLHLESSKQNYYIISF